MLSLIRRNRGVPTSWDLFDAGREFDRFFDATRRLSSSGWSPLVDVSETDDHFVVSAELPGLSAADVSVSVTDGVLSLGGEKKEEHKEGVDGSNRHVVERRYGSFQRAFTLPRGVDAARVSAKFDDGVLTVELPKAEAAKPRTIKISKN